MKNRARADITTITIMTIAAILFSAACAPRVEVALASTPEPTVSVTAAPTATPTVAPTSIPTPAVDEYGFTEERKAELNQQFQDFLNKEGEFTPEKMSQIMMETMSKLDKDEVGLGIVDGGDVPRIQGVFFDYLEKDGRIFLFVGFDGKDGSRFITPIEIPYYFYKSYEPAQFAVMKHKENSIAIAGEDINGEDYSNNEEKLVSLLVCLKGKVLIFNLNHKRIDESAGDNLNLDAKDLDDVNMYINEVNLKVELTFGLYQLLAQNKIPSYTNPDKIKGDSESILKLTNPEEMGKINIDLVPITTSIGYFAGEFSDVG